MDTATRISKGFKSTTDRFISPFEAATMWAAKKGWTYEIQEISKNPKPQFMTNETYEAALSIQSNWNPNVIRGYVSQLFEAIRERKYLCYKAENKIQVTVDIINQLQEKTIVFSQSTATADRLYYAIKELEIPTGVYHSNVESRPLKQDIAGNPSLVGTGDWIRIKTKKSPNYGEPKMYGADSINKLTLASFYNNVFKVLVAGTALDKGLDVPDVTCGIATSYNSTASQYIQRRGRLTRINQDNIQDVIMVNLYVPGTIEESALRFTEGKTAYWITSIEDVSLNYEESLDFIF